MPDLLPGNAVPRNQFIGTRDEVLPQAVARCTSTEDVRAALAIARERDWDFAIRGGGHSNACHSSSPGLVLDLSPMRSITIDSHVTVGAGVRVGHLAAGLPPRLVPSGSCPSVGLIGAALGGGFGSHGRQHGLTCDHLVLAEVVLADGSVVITDEKREPDLFWALRGAGHGNFGVVTKATFRAVPASPRTHVRLAWPLDHAPSLLRRWLAWEQPDDVSLELILLSPDDGAPQVMIVGAVPHDEYRVFLDVPPDITDLAQVTAAVAAVLHPTPASAVAQDPVDMPLATERPGMCTARTEFFDRALPDDAIDALLKQFTANRVPGELREIAFTPWGGAYRTGPDTAFAHRDAAYLVKHTVLVGPNGAVRRGHEALDWVTGSWLTVHDHGTGGCYPNFPDPALPDPLTSYYGPNLDRLTQVKRCYDPHNLFRYAQSLKFD